MYVVATAAYLIIVMLISPTDGTTADDSKSIWGSTLKNTDVSNGLFRIFDFGEVDNYFYLMMNVVYQVALVCLRRVRLGEMLNLYPPEIVAASEEQPKNTQLDEDRLDEV
jgi:hypothetical protein